MRLQLATWLEVESYLARSTGIVVPIGSTEQHGPNGLIGTDALCAEIIGGMVGDRAGAMVAPTIGVGMAHHHMAFAGTMTLRPTTLMAVISDYLSSLSAHGFRRFFFVNGHGGNVPTVRAAFYETYEERRRAEGDGAPDLRMKVANWWEAPAVGPISRELFPGAEGIHATPSEVAVTQWAFPDHIKSVVLDPPIAPSGEYFDWRDYRRRFPDGRIGSNPGLATPEAGKRLAEAAAGGLAALYSDFVSAP